MPSKQRGEAGGLEVLIVSECLGQSKSAHYPEGKMIHDPRFTGFAATIGCPSLLDFVRRGDDDQPFVDQLPV